MNVGSRCSSPHPDPLPAGEETQRRASPADIWVVAETDGERLKEVTLELLCDARDLAGGGAVSAIALGPFNERVGSQLGQYGAARILTAAGSADDARSAERCAAVLSGALERETPRLVLFAATPLGREIASRIAAARRLSLANNCNWLRITESEIEAARLIYGGKLYARVRLPSTPALVSVRPGAAGIGKPAPRQPEVVQLPPLRDVAARVESIAYIEADPRTIDITEADRIVAVGRGIGTRERLDLYERVAACLGASLAASRPVVDVGWLPLERQVGQTGRVVSPRLYIAAGISGASHHTLGMKESECIVAINSDKNAQIFKLADLKVVADVNAVVPKLVQRLETVGAGTKARA